MLAIDLDIVPNRDDPSDEAETATSDVSEPPIKLDFVPALAEMGESDAPIIFTIPDEPALPATETKAHGFFTRRNLALCFSIALHVSAAASFILLRGQDVQIAGGAEEEIVIWGTDLVDFTAAGAPGETIEPVDETAVAEPAAVEPLTPVQEMLQPVETANLAPEEIPTTPPAEAMPVEPLAPVEPELTQQEPSPQPPVEAQPVQPEQILAAPATPEPTETEPEIVAAAPIEPVEEPVEEILPEEDVVAVAEIPRPTPRPDYQPPKVARSEAAKPKQQAAAKKPEPKNERAAPQKQAANAGSGGRDTRDAKRGSAEGSQAAKGGASRGAGRASQAGNAAVSNYPGKIVAKLRRSLRYPREAQRQRLRGEVRVAFTVSGNGGVSGIRIVRSSGSPILDQAAVETVQRAAPFPKIPADAGRASWPFTVPLEFRR